MEKVKLDIDRLIEIVKKGGTVKTGVDIVNMRGVLLLEKDIMVNNADILFNIKNNGINTVNINPKNSGGLWNEKGESILLKTEYLDETFQEHKRFYTGADVVNKVREIFELKKEASLKYKNAKKSIKKVLADIKDSGGKFDFDLVEKTVTDLFQFLKKQNNAFSYLTKEIFTYDDYLYNHSINVCTIGTAVLNKFNENFGTTISKFLSTYSNSPFENNETKSELQFKYYLSEELQDMSYGLFLHDVGKVLLPEDLLNKNSGLTNKEFEIIKTHSFEKGVQILEANRLHNAFIRNITKFHHSALFKNEKNCYPDEKPPSEIPLYVKIGKLVDIYDAMTSKRAYKEAFNPIGVVTEIFHKYASKDPMLQFLLYSFVKVVGIYPPGSIVFLQNNQMAYVIDSEGPVVMPFTDIHGITLSEMAEPVNIGTIDEKDDALQIERRKPLVSPVDAYKILPSYLRDIV